MSSGITLFARALLTVAVLAAGFGMAFVSGETMGAAVLLVIPVVVVLLQRGRGAAGSFLITFGLGFVGGAVYILLRTSGVLSGSFSVGLGAYVASQLAIGVALIVAGCVVAAVRSHGRSQLERDVHIPH